MLCGLRIKSTLSLLLKVGVLVPSAGLEPSRDSRVTIMRTYGDWSSLFAATLGPHPFSRANDARSA
jgi:hypothetical protein